MRQKWRIIEERHHKFHMKSMNSFRIRLSCIVPTELLCESTGQTDPDKFWKQW